ncbi:uncharacterized protein LOC121747083 [Salvia splendens]|nr:uncharacterized protein LOC121747083 [Salvia splendens]XP_041996998.1 uncharacterized protein LOC121747083 [Salvia splendens]XP_041996999.1 uncharacterized protein LOC121747083 [Salvia splendens]XP_041997000.1 uncharacterized protein LOC121747083 [Salvia splendens]XP_041997001.1 uncharacterized protein LOC121747083 [Salvia splendens]
MTVYNIRCGSYNIVATVTSDPATAHRWVCEIINLHRNHAYRQRCLLVGLGVQWVSRHAATLQLCVGSNCLIFQLHHADHCPNVLRSFLVDQNVIRVALWDNAIGAMLWGSPHALWVGRVGDVRRAAYALMRCGRGATMGQLAQEILGIPGMQMDEAVACSDWEDQELTFQQVEYACHAVALPLLMALELRLWEYFL